jgi:hypothetical protein
LAEKELARSQQLAFKGTGSRQSLDADYTKYKSTIAALSAGHSQLVEAQSTTTLERFVTIICTACASDISQDKSFIAAPEAGKHTDPKFGTHHAYDA